jgi:fructuronate reductase
MTRLSEATLALAPPEVLRPAYDRSAIGVGVLHFGPGAFHRGHQAFYFQRMIEAGADLAICGVSLRSPDVRDALAPQDGLYALSIRDAEPELRVIGALREVIAAPEAPGEVLARLASPSLRVITATVTEKGYALDGAGELDLSHPDVRHDVARQGAPRSLAGWLVEGLRRRRSEGLAAPVVISCDNLSGNGRKLGRAVHALAAAQGDADLAAWIAAEVRFPDSMVDSITPATDEALRADVARQLGLEDAWPIQRERFTQWVVEDQLGPLTDTFRAAGVTVAGSVAPFERAKLRLLNGAHSTLAYVGLGLGHATVAQAAADPRLGPFVERMLREEVSATLDASELDVPAYITAVLARFRNPMIAHQLAQIAWDGSQKLRFRLIEPAQEALAAGRPIGRLAVGIAAWMRFVRQRASTGAEIVDPLAAQLLELGRGCDGGPKDVGAFLSLHEVFPRELASNPAFAAAVGEAYVALDRAPAAALA